MSTPFNYNAEVTCLIKSYDEDSRLFKVETLSSHIIGYIFLNNHPTIKTILKLAIRNHTIVPLTYKGYHDDKHWFRYNYTASSAPVSLPEPEVEETPVEVEEPEEKPTTIAEHDTLSVIFSLTDEDYNKKLLESLVSALGEIIDTDEKYDLAVGLIGVNRKLKLLKDLNKDLFSRSTAKYQAAFWSNEILPYCSNHIVQKAWKKANEQEKQEILARLGIELPACSPVAETDQASLVSTPQEPRINTGISTRKLENEAANRAIQERRTQQQTLANRQQSLQQRTQGINLRQEEIRREQQSCATQATQRMAQARTDSERQQIATESRETQQQLQDQLQQLNEEKRCVTHDLSIINTDINKTEAEIQTIKQSTEIETIGGRGALKINLKWNTIDDVDLHVVDPSGTKIYYGSKSHICQGVLGQLDVDMNVGAPFSTTPQENIYWENKAPLGIYLVSVNLFTKRSGVISIPFTVTVMPEKGEPRIFTGMLTTEKQTTDVIKLEVKENGLEYIPC